MRIDVAEMEIGQVLRATFEETVDSRTGDVAFDAPVTGEVEAGRTSATLYVRGRLTTTAPMVCGRCLGGFRQTLAISVDEEFQIGGAPTGGRGALGPEDFVVPLGPDRVLDVTEVARQHLLLALPMVPVCRPECRGLCPVCGENLNERECGCRRDAVDPRLAPLRNWQPSDQGTRGPRNQATTEPRDHGTGGPGDRK